MSGNRQEQCASYLNTFARRGDLRVLNRHGSCHVFVSDEAAERLRDDFGIETAASSSLDQVFKEYDLGRTQHYIPRESLTKIVGKFGLSDALHGVTNFISTKASNQAEGRG